MRFTQIIEVVCLCFLLNLVNIQLLFFKYFIRPTLSSPSEAQILALLIISHAPKILFIFFLSLFSFWFSKCYWIVLNFSDSIISHLHSDHPVSFLLCFVVHIPISIISYFFLLITFISLLNFSIIFPFFSWKFVIACWRNYVMAALKFLSDNFNIC